LLLNLQSHIQHFEFMKTDLQLKQEVVTRLAFARKIDPAGLGVSVEKGVVTLRGNLETDEDRTCAQRAVRFVKGVRELVDDDLHVRSAPRRRRNDTELEAAAGEAIEWLTTIPREAVKLRAEKGWLILEGEVETPHQARRVEEVLRELPGVRGVRNGLSVPEPQHAA
jgi:osmotically-inducible protein OsmY